MNKITRYLIDFLEGNLGSYRLTNNQLAFDCPICDIGSKKNCEICINSNDSKYLIFNCWSCKYHGFISKLLTKYAKNDSWKLIKEFKSVYNKDSVLTQTKKEIKIELPESISPYYYNKNISNYLIKERQIPENILIERNIQYVFDEESNLYNSIIFPYYENKELVGYTSQNFSTKKYRNHGYLDYVPYKEFIDINLPIIITEGDYDCLSVVNAIPCLNTKPNKAILEFCANKDVILGFDSVIDKSTLEENIIKFNYYGVRKIYILDIENHKDLNQFKIDDFEGLRKKLFFTYQIMLEN